MLKKTVALVGMMGAGKSAVGKRLAEVLNVPLKDSDAEIEKAANMPISEIFERDGEAFFRSAEKRVLERLLNGRPCILSTGGGAFVSPENRRLISDLGVSVWLNADLDILWERVKHKTTRPLLLCDDPFGRLSEIYNERSPVYGKADLDVKTAPEFSIDDTANLVLNALKTRNDVWEE